MQEDIKQFQTISITLKTEGEVSYNFEVDPQTSIYEIKKRSSVLLNKKFIYFDLEYKDQIQTVLTKYLNELPEYSKNIVFNVVEKSNQELFKSDIRLNGQDSDSSTIKITITWQNDPYEVELPFDSTFADLRTKITSILDIKEQCEIVIDDTEIQYDEAVIYYIQHPSIRLEKASQNKECEFENNARLVQSIASSEKGNRQEDFDGFENRIGNKFKIEKGKFGSLKKVDHLLTPDVTRSNGSDKKIDFSGQNHNLFLLQQQAKECISVASSSNEFQQDYGDLNINFTNQEGTMQYTLCCKKQTNLKDVFKQIAKLQKNTLQQLVFYLLQETDLEEVKKSIQENKLKKVKITKAYSTQEKSQNILNDKQNSPNNIKIQTPNFTKKSIHQGDNSKIQQLVGRKKMKTIKMQFKKTPKIEQRQSQQQVISEKPNSIMAQQDSQDIQPTKQTSYEHFSEKDQNCRSVDLQFEKIKTKERLKSDQIPLLHQAHQKTNSDNCCINEPKVQKTFQDLKRHLKQLQTRGNYTSTSTTTDNMQTSQDLLKKLNKLSSQGMRNKPKNFQQIKEVTSSQKIEA